MAKQQKGKKVLEVWTSDNWKLEKDGANIRIISGSGFYDKKRDNAPVKIAISIEEL